MRLIDVLDLQADNEIEIGMKLIVTDGNMAEHEFEYIDHNGGTFVDEDGYEMEVYYMLNHDFLNYEADLLEGKQ